ncbi:MAG: hypothetical protein ACXWJB_14480, partial [Limisphaerales bacterium]
HDAADTTAPVTKFRDRLAAYEAMTTEQKLAVHKSVEIEELMRERNLTHDEAASAHENWFFAKLIELWPEHLWQTYSEHYRQTTA